MAPVASRLRAALSLSLCAALIIGSAAPQAYAAAGKTFESKSSPKAVGAPVVLAPLPSILPRTAAPAVKAAPAEAKKPETTLERLAVPLPDFSAQGDEARGASEADFLRRVGLSKMPERPDELDDAPRRPTSPDDPRRSDDLGNVPRDPSRNDGPDGTDGPLFKSGLSMAKKHDGSMPERPDELDDAPRRPTSPDDPRRSDDLGNEPRDPGRNDGPDGTDGPLFKGRAKAQKGFSGPAFNLTLVALGAVAFAGFGAVGLPVLAGISSAVGALSAVPLIHDLWAAGPQASHLIPMFAALGMVPAVIGDQPPPPTLTDEQSPVQFVVVLKKPVQALSADMHLSFADVRTRKGFQLYRDTAVKMFKQLQAAGLSSDELNARGVAPVATYKRINAATLRVSDPSRADEIKAWLESQGHVVYDNSRRSIVRPVPRPADHDIRRNSVTMQENLDIIGASAVHKIARQVYGAPEMGLMGRLAMKLVGLAIPQVKHAVIDTGIDQAQPWLKGVLEKTTGVPAGDDDGHGTWTQGTELAVAPWQRQTATHYKAFVKGNATLDDILKALTMAANDGNLVISNSWGDDEGDPYSPDSQMVRKLAEEGHIMVFAAGNAGPRANTVGNPGGVVYKDAKTGALRVLSIPAAKRNKTVDDFSSRGPRPRKVKDDPNYPHVPTGPTAIGSNVEGPYPKDYGPDRVDPVYGPVKAEYGTSMATPAVAGAVVLLAMMFGVTTRGEKLDAIINALMATLEKTGQSPDAEGEGFLNVEAAYKALAAVMKPAVPGMAARLALKMFASSTTNALPPAIASELADLRRQIRTFEWRSHEFQTFRKVYDDDVDPMIDELEAAARARLRQIEKDYPAAAKRR